MLSYANNFISKGIDGGSITILHQAWTLAKKTSNLRKEADILLALSGAYFYAKEYDSVTHYLLQAEVAAKQSGNENTRSKAQKNLLMLYNMQGDAAKAEELIQRINKGLPTIKDKNNSGMLLYGIGAYFANKDYNELAIDYFIKALNDLYQTSDSLSVTNTLINIGTVYINTGQYDKAQYYLTEAFKNIPAQPAEKNSLFHAFVNFSLGELYREKGNDSGIAYYKAALPVFLEQDNQPYLCRAYLGIAQQLNKQKKLDEAADMVNKSLKIGTSNSLSKNLLSSIYITAGNILQNKKEWTKAENEFKKAIEFSSESDYSINRQRAYENLSTLYELQEKYQSAFEFERQGRLLADSILQQSNIKRIAELELKYQTERKENQIALLQKQNAIKDLSISNKNRAVILLVIGVGLIAALAFVIIYRIRLIRLQKETAIRNRIAADLHDEVGSTLSSISLLTEMASSQLSEDDKSAALMKKTSTDARRMMENMDDIVWSINPQNDEFKNLETRIKEYALPLMPGKNIDFEVMFEDRVEEVKLSMEQRRELYLIIKEALNNLVKYSEATQASLKFIKQDRQVVIEIKDNGVGFDVAKAMATSRNGLKSMQKRTAALKAKINMDSTPGSGTTITIYIS